MTNSLIVIAKVFSNTLVFLLQKCECTAKATQKFSTKISMYMPYFKTEILTSC